MIKTTFDKVLQIGTASLTDRIQIKKTRLVNLYAFFSMGISLIMWFAFILNNQIAFSLIHLSFAVFFATCFYLNHAKKQKASSYLVVIFSSVYQVILSLSIGRDVGAKLFSFLLLFYIFFVFPKLKNRVILISIAATSYLAQLLVDTKLLDFPLEFQPPISLFWLGTVLPFIGFLFVLFGFLSENEQQAKDMAGRNKRIRDEKKKLQEENELMQRRNIQAEIIEKSFGENLDLHAYLQFVLKTLLNLKWLPTKSQGAIFVTNENEQLELIAVNNFAPDKIKMCNLVEKGDCICGLAMQNRETIFSDKLRTRFENSKEELRYFHLKVPIAIGQEVLGVLSLLIIKPYSRKDGDIEFIESVAHLLAQIIKRHQLQQKLQNEKVAQNKLNQQLFARSLEIDQQNIEIQQINSKLQQTIDQLEKAKEHIDQQHRDITASIRYGKTIQDAMLPRKNEVRHMFDAYFLIFRPRDWVSGDFYFARKIENKAFFCVGDCTGHGVPGGFLTMMSISLLSDLTKQHQNQDAGTLLEILRSHVKELFGGQHRQNSDGLDISFGILEGNQLSYSGANNDLYIIRNQELIVYKATRNPIGIYPREKKFETQHIELMPNDMVYMYTDGYSDQFSEKSDEKFSKKRFKKLLIKVSTLPVENQKKILLNTLDQWKGNHEQIDDITVFGFRFRPKSEQ